MVGMPRTRVYLPLSRDDVLALAGEAALPGEARVGHAVTAALGRPGIVVDAEELEHEAWLLAAEAAAVGASVDRRRVIAAADVDPNQIREGDGVTDPSAVLVGGVVTLRDIVSFHIDDEPGGIEPTDLLWYDVTELATVVDLV